MIVQALQRNPLFIVGGAAAARLPAALQQLLGRPVVRQPRRQLDPPGAGHGAPHPHRPVVHAVPRRPRGLRRRRAGGRGHLRRPQREAAGGSSGALPVDQPAPRAAGDTGRPRLLVLLAAEHGPRRRRPDAAVRPRRGHPRAAADGRGACRRPCSSPACTTTCCGAGPSCRAVSTRRAELQLRHV